VRDCLFTENQLPRKDHPVTMNEDLIDPAALARRRRILRVLTVAAAAVAMFASGWGMWTFFADLPRLNHWYLILPMFLLFDLAAVACAWGARINRLTYGRMGVQGWLVWLFAATSGFMSSSDASGRESAVRFAAPVVAAILFELLIRGERRDLTHFEGPIDRIRRRLLARLGLLDDVDQDDESAARSRMAAKLAAAAYRVHQTKDGTRARRRTLARYHRRLRVASVRMGFATDQDMIDEVRVHLDALYRSVSGTAPAAVADLNVWQSAAPTEPDNELEPAADIEDVPAAGTPRVRVVGARRTPGRRGKLAGRGRRRTAPVEVPVAKVSDFAVASMSEESKRRLMAPAPDPVKTPALNGHTKATTTAPLKPAAKKKPAKKPARRAGALDDATYDKAFRYWQAETDRGNPVSAAALGEYIGRSKATGGRLLQEFREKVSA
jgi:hypothetical protein